MEKNWIFFIFLLFLMPACTEEYSEAQLEDFLQGIKDKPKIALQPFGNIHPIYITHVRDEISNYYGMEVAILPHQPLPRMCYNTAVAKRTGLDLPLRYRADSLLVYLSKNLTEEYDIKMGITDQDITCTRRDEEGEIMEPVWVNADWGIFGLGYYPGEACMISLYRIMAPYNVELSKQRLGKVAKHELGHNLGLDHCENECFMNEADLSNAIAALDAESELLCNECKIKIMRHYF